MRITSIKPQKNNQDRVNIFVDGKYSFSLNINQLISTKLKTGLEIDDDRLDELKNEGYYGKLLMYATKYLAVRQRSEKEVGDYLRRKLYKDDKLTFVSYIENAILELREKKYLDDNSFALFWIQNRRLAKGVSNKVLSLELKRKGVPNDIIADILRQNIRLDKEEIKKVIAKKARKYPDQQGLMNYLARQGYSFDDIREALDERSSLIG